MTEFSDVVIPFNKVNQDYLNVSLFEHRLKLKDYLHILFIKKFANPKIFACKTLTPSAVACGIFLFRTSVHPCGAFLSYKNEVSYTKK